MKKFLTLGAALLLIMTLFIMITAMNADHLVRAYSAKAVHALQKKKASGITLERLDLPPPIMNIADRTLIWPHLDAQITITQGHEWLAGKTVTLHMDNLQVTMDSVFSNTFVLMANAISATVQDQEPHAASQAAPDGITRLSDGNITVPIQLDLWPPGSIKQQAQDLSRDLLRLLQTGSTPVPVSFSGISSFRINNENITAKLSVQEKDTSYRLTMDQESLQIISWILAEKLTEPEEKLLSQHPFKAPRLLQIRNDAQEAARLAHAEHDIIPEDAYRHVLWSYVLTKTYGQDFAKEVTDAHEQGKTDNTPAEHRMDYANNAVGRKYAAKNYQRDEIIDHLLRDPEVIREAHAPITH